MNTKPLSIVFAILGVICVIALFFPPKEAEAVVVFGSGYLFFWNAVIVAAAGCSFSMAVHSINQDRGWIPMVVFAILMVVGIVGLVS